MVFIMTALLFAGCGGSAPQPSGESPAPGGDGSFPVTFVDTLGREVTIAQEPQKVISLTPAITEILFAIGAGDKVAAVTDHC